MRATPALLVAAYAFDEGSGATIADASGSGNLGTTSNTIWEPSGKYGQALSFDGSSAMVTIPDSTSLDLTTGMTLEAWVKPSDVSNIWRDVVYKGDDVYYLEATSPSNVPVGGAKVGSPPNLEAYGPGPLVVDTWTHLAVTYDGADLRLYVDGALVSSQARTGSIETSTYPVQIGGDSLYSQRFAGLIDEVRIYDGALTAAQVQADMNMPITPPHFSIVSPAAAATVSHVVEIAASATATVHAASVEFFVDGNSLGTDTAVPFRMNWNSTTVSNGTHTIVAVARDSFGTPTSSEPIEVTSVNPAFVDEVLIPGVTSATTMAFLPDGRMLVGELINKIWVVQPGATVPDSVPFLDLDYSELFGEQGLMDIKLDPNFAENNYFYVFYTHGFAGQHNRDTLSRFTASGNGIVPGSEFVLWQDDVDANAEHHGGAIDFGLDGKLYFTVGDHFFYPNAQDLASYHGKVMRINLDGTIPTDNPFYDGAGPNKDTIWAYGLRNPYRMSIDQVTGRMYIGDVGGNDASTAIEEINLGVAGANYGWPLEEGNGGVPGMTPPIHSYAHNGRDGAVTGGFVYRGSQFPAEYVGSYFFADYVQNTFKRLTFDENGNVANVLNFWPADGATDQASVGDPVKLLEGPDGSLYYVDIGFNDQHVPNDAAIRRIRYTVADQPPVAVASASPLLGLPPLVVDFSSVGSYDPEGATLAYAWDFGDGSTSTEANPTHTYLAAGPYVAQLTVSDGVNATLASELSITVGNLPVPNILGPADGMLFRAGDVINYSGSATDPDEGTLATSAFTWTILFHHDSHVHPAGGPFTNTTTGTLTIPTSGHDFQDETYYQIVLTVNDSSGLSASTSVSVYPEKVNLSFDTVPSGLTLSIDGLNKQTPFVLDDLVGFQHTIAAPAQSIGSSSYAFMSWSDGGAQSHGIVTLAMDQSFVATFIDLNAVIVGDMNGDGLVNNFDIFPFEQALVSPSLYLEQFPALVDYAVRGDINDDGLFNNFDIAPFESLLTGAPGDVPSRDIVQALTLESHAVTIFAQQSMPIDAHAAAIESPRLDGSSGLGDEQSDRAREIALQRWSKSDRIELGDEFLELLADVELRV